MGSPPLNVWGQFKPEETARIIALLERAGLPGNRPQGDVGASVFYP